MFGRRRHVAPVPVAPPAPAPRLTEADVAAVVQRTVDAFLGSAGAWTVSMRSSRDTDSIFDDVISGSLAASVTAALTDAQARLEADPTVSPVPAAAKRPEHLARRADPIPALAEPVALSWTPSPITRWADLTRPVTGDLSTVGGREAEAERPLVA